MLSDKTEFKIKLTRIVLPITLQNFMLALLPVSDCLMLATLDQDSMSAVSLAGQLFFIMTLFTNALTAGAGMFASQYWGNDDKASIEKLLGLCFLLTLPIAIVFFCFPFFFPKTVMQIYTDEPAIIDYGINYLVIVAPGFAFECFTMLYHIFMKNIDMVKESAVISIITCLMNIALNAVFIFGLIGKPLAERGAALGTTLSCLFAMVLSIALFTGRKIIRLRLNNIIRPGKELFKRFCKYAVPILGNSLGWGIGFTTITIIMGHLGSDAVAANSIVAVAKDLISCFCFALASGAVILVGNELGAGQLERARNYGRYLCHLAIVSGIISGVVLAALAPIIVRFVNLSDRASYYLLIMLLMCIYYMLGRSLNSTIISGIFTAGGDTRFGFICDTITMWVFIIPAGALAAFYFDLPVLWVFFILNLDEIIKLPVVYLHYIKYKWLKTIIK